MLRDLGQLLLWFLGVALLWRIPTLERHGARRAGKAPRVSVVIPARNEASNLPPLLASLARQTIPLHQVIVVDGGSSDDTATIARDLGATVLTAETPPEGWVGKPWACWQGAQQSSGELLLFLDADTRLAPTAVQGLVDVYAERGGLVTLQPYHVTERAYEQLSAFFNIVLMAALNAFTPLGGRLAPAGGFGACVLCSREDYFRLEGHAGVRREVLEDIALAKRFQAAGRNVACLGGRGAVIFRMYPGGFGELLEGWSKGFGTGAAAIRPLFLALTVAWVWGCFGTLFGLFRAFADPRGTLPLALLFYLLYVLQLRWILARIGRFRVWTVVLYPLPLCFFALTMLRSLILIHVLGRVSWRGRVISTRPSSKR